MGETSAPQQELVAPGSEVHQPPTPQISQTEAAARIDAASGQRVNNSPTARLDQTQQQGFENLVVQQNQTSLPSAETGVPQFENNPASATGNSSLEASNVIPASTPEASSNGIGVKLNKYGEIEGSTTSFINPNQETNPVIIREVSSKKEIDPVLLEQLEEKKTLGEVNIALADLGKLLVADGDTHLVKAVLDPDISQRALESIKQGLVQKEEPRAITIFRGILNAVSDRIKGGYNLPDASKPASLGDTVVEVRPLTNQSSSSDSKTV